MTNKTELDEIALPLLDSILKEAQDKWKDPNAKYREYRNLQIDKRGSFGERFFAQSFMKIYPRRIKIEYADGDQGDWDINNFKFEIKTASIDVNNKFQNEGLKKDGDYHGIMFLGITPNQLYTKFIKQDDIPFDTLHNRGKAETGKGYKWDFKKQDMIEVFNLADIKNQFENAFPDVARK